MARDASIVWVQLATRISKSLHRELKLHWVTVGMPVRTPRSASPEWLLLVCDPGLGRGQVQNYIDVDTFYSKYRNAGSVVGAEDHHAETHVVFMGVVDGGQRSSLLPSQRSRLINRIINIHCYPFQLAGTVRTGSPVDGSSNMSVPRMDFADPWNKNDQ